MTRIARDILLIDDDIDIQKLFRKLLENSGYQVRVASNVHEASSIVKGFPPHLILLDIMLDGESGLSYLARHQKDPSLADVPVIVCSGTKQKDIAFQALSLGASDYIMKPVESHILLQKIRKTLKDQRFTSLSFPPGRTPKVKVKIQGTIVSANETGFLFEAPLKIDLETILQVQSPLFETLGCEDAVFQRTKSPTIATGPGQYLNDIAVLGLSPDSIRRIRRLVGDWK